MTLRLTVLVVLAVWVPAVGADGVSPIVAGPPAWAADVPPHIEEVAVYLVLEAPALATLDAREQGVRSADAGGRARVHLEQRIAGEQQALRGHLASMGAQELRAFQILANALMVTAPRDELAGLAALPGVVRVDPVGVYSQRTSTSVPWVAAPELWSVGTGVDGRGVRVGIIDSGIDYLHAHFGGPGRAQDYGTNDPKVIEPGTFPTAKVVGGWDFAGDFYHAGSSDSQRRVPQPDPDPLDCGGHGSHVAGIAAGFGVTAGGATYQGPLQPGLDPTEFRIGPGVAPAALLYAYKVFGCEGSTNLVTLALERAADPNQDGDTSDRLDVVNLSLGCDFGCGSPTELAMVANLSALGTVVVASAGNAGDTFFISGSPASAATAVSVAASYDDGLAEAAVEVVSPEVIAGMYGAVEGGITRPLAQVGTIEAAVVATMPADACAGLSNPAALAGKIALIDRGTCRFDEKIPRAQAAGAVAVVMVNNLDDPPVAMGGDLTVAIPGVMVSRADGATIRQHLPGGVTMRMAGGMVKTMPELADLVAAFSSRGPGQFGGLVKPDITAPGVAVTSAAVGSGAGGRTLSGTSMAAPHVAGAAALVRQLYPEWSAHRVKAALMNTAVATGDGNGNPYSTSRVGAGRLSLTDLGSLPVTVSVVGVPGEVAIGFGTVAAAEDTVVSRVVRVANSGGEPLTLAVSVRPILGASGAVLVPGAGSVTVPAGGETDLTVTLEVRPGLLNVPPDPTTAPEHDGEPRHRLPEVTGQVHLEHTASGRKAMIPYYAVVRAATAAYVPGGAVCLPPVAGTVELPVLGAVGHPHPRLAIFQLGREAVPAGSADPLRAAAELVVVGAGSDFASAGSLAATTLYFAIATREDWPSLQPDLVRFEVWLDVDRDATVDWELATGSLGTATGGAATDTFMVTLRNRRTGATQIEGLANVFPADALDLPAMFTNVVVLPVRASSLGLTGTPATLDYFVRSLVQGSLLATVGRSVLTVQQPLVRPVGADESGSPFQELAASLEVMVDPQMTPEYPGVLLLFPHNPAGSRWQVVPLAPGPGARLTLDAPTLVEVPSQGPTAIPVTVRNLGPGVAAAAVLAAEAPVGLVPASGTGPAGPCQVQERRLTCALGSLAVGSEVQVSLVFDGAVGGEAGVSLWASSTNCHPSPVEAGVVVRVRGVGEQTATRLLPAMAHTTGYAGVPWRSEVSLVNDGPVPVVMELEFRGGGLALTEEVVVAGGGSVAWRDVLGELFGVGAAVKVVGVVEVRAAGPVAVAARTYADRGSDGTYGQWYPALGIGDGVGYGEVGVVPLVRSDAGFYTNIGALNLGEASCTMVWRFLGEEGDLLGQRQAGVAAGAWWQLSEALEQVGATGARWARVEVVTPGCRVWAAASVVDRTTRDPATVPAVRAGGVTRLLPAMAHTTGYAGVPWRSEVSLVNDGPVPVVMELEFRGGGLALTEEVVVPGGGSVAWRDVLGELFGVGATVKVVGVVEVRAAGPVAVAARTYADRGSDGTYGQWYPALGIGDGVGYGEVGVVPLVRSDAGFYTNIGALNLGEASCTMVWRFLGEEGDLLGQRQAGVAAGAWWQLSEALEQVGATGARWARVEVVTPGCRVWAAASVVDRTTRDPATVPAVPEPWG